MKTLLLLRHAKSSWSAPMDDHDRPLNGRGKVAAPRMGELLKEEGLLPERIISSTAKRARSTAKRVAESADHGKPLIHDEALYAATVAEVLHVIRQTPDDCHRLLVVGHNPSMEDTVEALTAEIEVMPTAALAQINLHIDTWADIQADRTGELIHVWRPRELE